MSYPRLYLIGAVLYMIASLGFFAGTALYIVFGSDCPDTTEQTRTREIQWAKQMQELRGRAFRAEQATTEAMMEAAELRDLARPWQNAYFLLVEQGTPEWAAAMRAKGFVSNSVLAVEGGVVR